MRVHSIFLTLYHENSLFVTDKGVQRYFCFTRPVKTLRVELPNSSLNDYAI